jgi:hypothetical protein
MACLFVKNPQVVKPFPSNFLPGSGTNESPSPASEGLDRLISA